MILITSGCSFSDIFSQVGNFIEYKTDWFEFKQQFASDLWPVCLQKYLKCDHMALGLQSQGNGLISRKTIYNVAEALKTHKPEDIRVGIMWSGMDRHEVYNPTHSRFRSNYKEGRKTNIVNDEPANWIILNTHWQFPLCKTYYHHFHLDVSAQLNTYEHILRTQLFLEKYNIKYFMTTYTNASMLIDHPECNWIRDLIDFSKFLPIKEPGMKEWTEVHGDVRFPSLDGFHPQHIQHSLFTDRVILPYIRENGWLQ